MFTTLMIFIFASPEVIGNWRHTSGVHGKGLFRPRFRENSGRNTAAKDEAMIKGEAEEGVAAEDAADHTRSLVARFLTPFLLVYSNGFLGFRS